MSGINAGANTGDVAHASGTVGAAMEAWFHGVPAIATSQDTQQDYALTARLTARIVRQVLATPLPRGVIVSINVPRGEVKGVKAAPMGGTYFGVGSFEEVEQKGATVVYRSVVRGAERGGGHTGYDGLLGRLRDGDTAPLRLDRRRDHQDSLRDGTCRSGRPRRGEAHGPSGTSAIRALTSARDCKLEGVVAQCSDDALGYFVHR